MYCRKAACWSIQWNKVANCVFHSHLIIISVNFNIETSPAGYVLNISYRKRTHNESDNVTIP